MLKEGSPSSFNFSSGLLEAFKGSFSTVFSGSFRLSDAGCPLFVVESRGVSRFSPTAWRSKAFSSFNRHVRYLRY